MNQPQQPTSSPSRFCSNCGSALNPQAGFCSQCGMAVVQAEPPAQQAPRPGAAFSPTTHVPNYLAQAILVTIFCCLPFGIVSIVFAAQVNRKLGAGDYAGALEASKKAKTWAWVSLLVGSGIILIILAVLVIVSFALTAIPYGGGGGVHGTGSSRQHVSGIGERQAITGNTHVDEGVSVSYSSYPPTSGDHWPPEEQARCGFYEGGVEDERAVHNMEHSNIVVSYNLATQEEVDQLRDAIGNIGLANVWGVTRSYDERPEDLAVGQIAVTTWGVIDIMEGIDPDRIERFFEAYAGTIGPESVPCLG